MFYPFSKAFFLAWISLILSTSTTGLASSCRYLMGHLRLAPPSPIDQWVETHSPVASRFIREQNRVVVVVPVYRELRNGNLERLLEAFRLQSASRHSFKLVLVVNNTPEVASLRDEVWQENQETLAYLKSKTHGLTLEVLDHSTEGVKRNIGYIRDLGVREVLRRMPVAERVKTIIAQFDADTIPPTDYVRDLQQAFLNPEVTLALFSLESRLDPGQRELFSSFFDMNQTYARQDYRAALYGSWPKSGLPRIATRAESLRAAGGVPHVGYAEDSALIKAIRTEAPGKIAYLWRNPVVTSDRARADGYDAKDRLESFEFEEASPLVRNGGDLEPYYEVLAHFSRLRRRLPPAEHSLLQRELEFQMLELKRFHEANLHALETLTKRMLHGTSPLTRDDVPSPLHLFWDSEWFRLAMEKAVRSAVSADSITEARSLEAPGFFSQSDSPCPAYHAARRRALTRFFLLARDFPSRFPQTLNYLKQHREDQLESVEKAILTWFPKPTETQKPASDESVYRLLAASDLDEELSVYRVTLNTTLGFHWEIQSRLINYLPGNPRSWSAEDRYVAKNVSKILLGAYDHLQVFIAATEKENGANLKAQLIDEKVAVLQSDVSAWHHLFALLSLNTLDSQLASLHFNRLYQQPSFRMAFAQFRELEGYWLPHDFSSFLRTDVWIHCKLPHPCP